MPTVRLFGRVIIERGKEGIKEEHMESLLVGKHVNTIHRGCLRFIEVVKHDSCLESLLTVKQDVRMSSRN